MTKVKIGPAKLGYLYMLYHGLSVFSMVSHKVSAKYYLMFSLAVLSCLLFL